MVATDTATVVFPVIVVWVINEKFARRGVGRVGLIA
jgi:hypothetical protein